MRNIEKNEWRNPRVICLGIDSTKSNPGISTFDLGHGYDDYPGHTHHCICGAPFDTWTEAKQHEHDMTTTG